MVPQLGRRCLQGASIFFMALVASGVQAHKKAPPEGRLEHTSLRSEDRKHGAIQAGQLSFLKTLGLEDLGADEGECVHGWSLEMTAPFPAAKSCIPRRGTNVKKE